ncbi:VCBS repeat-containing protein [Mycobacterium sp. BK558]|nr:VCBS repeat-containing protein [Mycobacterium sp. BK558]
MARCDRPPKRWSTSTLFTGVALIGIGIGLAAGPGVAAAAPADSVDTTASADADTSTDTGTAHAAPDTEQASRHAAVADTEPADTEPADTESLTETGSRETSTAGGRHRRAARHVEARAEKADAAATPDRPAIERPEAPEPPAPAAARTTEAVTVDSPPERPSLRSVVSARPVTVKSIATDVLTWSGLRPLPDGLPLPSAPVSALVQSLWLGVRQSQYTLHNQRPTAEPTTSGPGPDGTLRGSLNATDYDDAALTYTVSSAGAYGTVSIDADGGFVYTPFAGKAGRADSFTVTVDDTPGNPFHVHGLLGLLGANRPTEVVIAVPADAALAAGAAPPRRIDGPFTDRVVTDAAAAAAVMNDVAATLGAAAGFADPAAISTVTAGTGDTAETFYRYTETVGGIPVVGSDVILVTDASGTVTGLFNNYRGVSAAFDVTPDARMDGNAEIAAIARPRATFTKQLVIYAPDDQTAPSLAWRVVGSAPRSLFYRPGTTWLVGAEGAQTATVLVSVPNAVPLTAVNSAKDWSGRTRLITVDVRTTSWFTTYRLIDAGRDITTYKTSYPFFGLGGGVLPGTVVKRGLLGWNAGGVSAHANTALVYDYYRDVLGRTSFDGSGAPVDVSILYNPQKSAGGYANAFWDPGREQLAFGDSGHLEAAVDVIGHEFTHAVISFVVGGPSGGSVLDYGESGALNEAMADIMGMLIENKSGTQRWLLGEDSQLGAVRNLADPTSISTSMGPYRDTYASRYKGLGDDAGEHVNSTIFSHAAYLMMTDPATAGISNDMWATVFYHALYRLSTDSVFTDGRAAVLSAARALGLTAAQQSAIGNAFDTVGIPGDATSSVVAA